MGIWSFDSLGLGLGLVCNDAKHSKIEEVAVVELDFLPHSNRMLQFNRENHIWNCHHQP